MLDVLGISKQFGETKALDKLSFSVTEGKAFGLLGRNGAGKTTAIRIIMNIFKADAGSVYIDGETAGKSKRKIGYLPEERGLYQKRVVQEQMVYIGMLRGLTKKCAIRNTRNRLEELEAIEYSKRKLDTLSKGNQQKIQLAVALIADPDILILDEPFSGLDPVNAILLKNIVRNQVNLGRTVIFSSHQMPLVEEFCDEICIVDKGRAVLSGSLSHIKRSYPRNIYYVELEEHFSENLAMNVKSALGTICRSITIEGRGINVELSDRSKRIAIFDALRALGHAPEVLMVKEPSLEEIFVEYVGRNKEG
ncbi:MAG: ATP-binding cassette domain-containing protein [Clostridiales bacterium]|jgi:ABC-2 type transport system ATP-binding protein|nr:ATP-binding cassette domain-containing protein [Clostridiales bacterium]